MQKLLTIIFTILFLNLNSQVIYPIYNSNDSTFTFSFSQSLEIIKIKKKKNILEHEIKILSDIGYQQERVIEKLNYKDSLSRIEIEQYENMNNILNEKLNNTASIIDNYSKHTNELKIALRVTEKALRREKLWKNIYKFGLPAIGITALIFLK